MKRIILLAVSCFLFNLLFSQSKESIGKLYMDGKFQEVISACERQLETESTDIDMKILIGRSFTDLENYDKAIPYLKQGIQENNKPYQIAWSYAYLGICYYFTDNYQESKNSLIKAIKLNATKNATNFAIKRGQMFQMADYFESWSVVETENIRFHFQNPDSIENIEQYIKVRQIAFDSINNFFKANLSKRIEFYVWNSKTDAKSILGKDIGFSQSQLYSINAHKDQTKGHELTHILLDHSMSPTAKEKLINEGVSVYFDLTKRNKLQEAQKVIVGKNISVKKLWSDLDNDELVYPLGGALIAYLRELGGDEKLKELLSNQTLVNAKKIYGKDFLTDFEAQLIPEKK